MTLHAITARARAKEIVRDKRMRASDPLISYDERISRLRELSEAERAERQVKRETEERPGKRVDIGLDAG